MKSIIVNFLLVCCCTLFISNEGVGQSYLVKEFGTKQGLASAEIYTLFQDKQGFIWLGTKFGVSQFDGVHFINYNGTTLQRFGKVYAITQDSSSTIWVGAEHGLFYMLNGEFQQVDFDKDFSSDWIYALHITRDNALWIGTSGGPIEINTKQLGELKQGSTLHYNILKGWRNLSNVGNQVLTMFELTTQHDSKLFFGTRGKVFAYDHRNISVVWESKEPRLEDVSGIQINKQNELLIGTRAGYFYKQNATGFDTLHTFTYAIGMQNIGNNDIVVLGYEGIYNINNNAIRRLTEIASIGYDSPSCLLVDKEKNLWVGTWEGLVQLRKNTLQTWLPGTTPYLNDIFSVTQFSSGDMLFGGNRGNVLTKSNQGFEPFFPNNQKPWPLSEVFGIYEDGKNIWMGSGYQGISAWDGKKMINYDGTILSDEHAHNFFRDDQNNFYALSEGGLTQIIQAENPSLAKFIYYPWPVDIGGQYLKIFDYAVLENNAIYLATNFGVVYFDGDTLLPVTTNDALLNNAIVTSFATTDKKSIWLSTGNYGIYKIIPNKTKAVTEFHNNVNDGLLADAVLDIIYDDANKYLWCAHYNGISVLNLKSEQPTIIKRITKDEGFLAPDFTYCKLAIQLPELILWIATTAGVQQLDIKTLPINTVPATPVINKVLLFNNESALSAYAKNRNKLSGLWLNPKFPHNKNAISFHFQSLSLVIPELNRCRYKLIGYNENWVYTTNIGEVTFAALSPGDYTFVLEAANNDGLWNTNPVSYSFTITKPYWATWWFILLAVLTAILISYGIYRYRINQLIKIGNIRNKIAGDLHDDIGSTLSSISMYSEIVRNQIGDKTDVNDELLKKITQNSKEMVDNMSDIVWAIKPENDRFKNIESRMFNFATEMCNLKGVELKMDKSHIDGDIKIRMEERRDFYLLFKEAVNNAIKYAQCSTLMVNFNIEQKTLVLTIADNGKGFDVNLAQQKGNGLSNMVVRARQHKGDCLISSAIGKGTVVTVLWPLT